MRKYLLIGFLISILSFTYSCNDKETKTKYAGEQPYQEICIDGVKYILNSPSPGGITVKFNKDGTVALCDSGKP